MVTCGSAPPSAMTRSARAWPMFGLRHQKARQVLGLGDRRRQPDGRKPRRQPEQPRQPEREQIAALAGDQRMQFVEHDALERAEQIRRVGGGQQQRKLLRRRQQDVRRIAALALALGGRGVAGAGLDADRQAHLGDRRFQVARDIDGQRLERRDVERVQALASGAGPCRSKPAGAASRRSRGAPPGSAETRPASCRRRSARSAAPSGHRGRATAVQAGARAASSRAARTSARTFRAAAARRRRVRERSRAGPSVGRWQGRGDRHQTRHPVALLFAGRNRGEMRKLQAPPPRSRRGHALRHGRSARSAAARMPGAVMRLNRKGEQTVPAPARRPPPRRSAQDRRNRRTRRRRGRDGAARPLPRQELGQFGGVEPVVDALAPAPARSWPAKDPCRRASRRYGRIAAPASPVPQPRSSTEPNRSGFARTACERIQQDRRPAIIQPLHQRLLELRRVLVEQPPHVGRGHRRRRFAGAQPRQMQPRAVIVLAIGRRAPPETLRSRRSGRPTARGSWRAQTRRWRSPARPPPPVPECRRPRPDRPA